MSNLIRFYQYLKRCDIVLLVAIILGTILRIYNLTYEGLWYDEIHSVNQAAPQNTYTEVIQYSKQDQPPLFFLSLHIWFKIFGFNDFSARFFVAFIGVIAIPTTYALGIKMGSKSIAQISALLLSVNYFHIYYSREVRFYSLLYLMSTISFLFFLYCLDSKERRFYFGYLVATVSLLYTHYYGMIIFGSQILIFFFLYFFVRDRIQSIAYSLSAGVLAGLSICFWLPQIVSDLGISSFWIQPVEFPRFILVYFYKYFDNLVIAGILAFFLLWFFLRLFVLKKINQESKIDLFFIYILLAWISISLLLPYLYSVFRMPMLIVRYTIVTLPAVILLVAFSISTLPRFRIILALIVLGCISHIIGYNHYTLRKKEQVRDLVREVAKDLPDSTTIFSYYAWHMNYYFQQFGAKNKAKHPNEVNYLVELNNSNYIWILQFHEDNIGATNEQIALINESFDHIKSVKFLRAQGNLYKRKNIE